MSLSTVTDNNTGWALFLDVDGTLLEIAETPQDVCAPAPLPRRLHQICKELSGALALVSGRSLADLDRLFAPRILCAAGVHGFERRDGLGRLHEPDCDSGLLDPARESLGEFVRAHEGLLLEDKQHALAVHFRRAPHLAASAYREVTAALAQLGPGFVLQRGKCVFEIRSRAHDKGRAVAAFMREPPFRGRTPVYAGDDVTDEDAFAVVNDLKGVSIKVGESGATAANYRLGSVADVMEWLGEIPRSIEALHLRRAGPIQGHEES